MSRFLLPALVILLLLLFSSCNPARRLPDGSYLLNRNHIEIDDAEVKRSDLTSYLRQRPNRRIFGFYRFHLNVYQIADGGRENRFKRWMKNTIGEPPVIYDRTLSHQTMRQFEMYLHSKGYFHADITFEENLRRRRANITYSIQGNEPYTIRDLIYNIPDSHVKNFVLADTVNSHIHRGQRYDADNLNSERNRISRQMRDDGFYRFSRDFVHFKVDSNLNSRQVDIELRISNPQRPAPGIRDSVIPERHKRYMIDHVAVLPEYSPLTANLPRSDTTVYRLPERRGDGEHIFHFYHNGPLRIRPSAIVSHVMLRQNRFFRVTDVEQTYTFLSEMRNFRLINLNFAESQQPFTGTPSDTLGFLNATVQLNRSPANAFTIEAEGLNTAGNLGVASNVLYQNRNVFQGAEIFRMRLKGALEVAGESPSDEVFQRLPFNTLEIGLEAGIDFPRLLLPFSIERLSRNSRPKTSIVGGINFRQRPDYTRYILNLTYGFEWNETSRKRHFIYPLEASSVRVFNDSILRANIPDANPFILSRFRDHFILGLKYTYIYNSQQIGRPVDFMYLRTNFESAGVLLSMAADALNLEKDREGSYNVFNIPFSQFVKGDADFRYYRVFDERQSLVFRIMGGIGIPYGNVDVLPFIKSYYGGGANGLRAWRIYTLGPGSYSDPDSDRISFDRYGDVKLEVNAEYRFRLYGIWHGAFFADAGNVWFVNKNDQFPGGEFRLSHLGNDIAIGAGMGLRLDFNFFILRVDAAVPVKDPAKFNGKQWISSWPSFSDYNFNLGIGYPF